MTLAKALKNYGKKRRTRPRQLQHFYYRYTGLPVAYSYYAYSKQDVKRRFKEEYGLKRLPDGFEVWK